MADETEVKEAEGSSKGAKRASSLIIYSRTPARRRAGFVFGTDGARLSGDQLSGLSDSQYNELVSDPYLLVLNPSELKAGEAKRAGSDQEQGEARTSPETNPPVITKHETITPAMEAALQSGGEVPMHPASVGGGNAAVTSIGTQDIANLQKQDTLAASSRQPRDMRVPVTDEEGEGRNATGAKAPPARRAPAK